MGLVPLEGTSLAGQWLRLCLPMQRAQAGSLVRELRSHMTCSVAKGKKKRLVLIKFKKKNRDLKRSPPTPM